MARILRTLALILEDKPENNTCRYTLPSLFRIRISIFFLQAFHLLSKRDVAVLVAIYQDISRILETLTDAFKPVNYPAVGNTNTLSLCSIMYVRPPVSLWFLSACQDFSTILIAITSTYPSSFSQQIVSRSLPIDSFPVPIKQQKWATRRTAQALKNLPYQQTSVPSSAAYAALSTATPPAVGPSSKRQRLSTCFSYRSPPSIAAFTQCRRRRHVTDWCDVVGERARMD